MDGLSMSFSPIKIPAGGMTQFEIPTENPDNPDYAPLLEGVILHHHLSCAYWVETGEDDDDEDKLPLCSSYDGIKGIGTPGGACATCQLNSFGSGPRVMPSQFYYCLKAAQLLKPMSIMALVVPASFLSDTFFTDGKKIKLMENHFSFLGQRQLPEDAFSYLGVSGFPTKVQFWQKHSEAVSGKAHKYTTDIAFTLGRDFDVQKEADRTYQKLIELPKSMFQENSSKVLLELARSHSSSTIFQYEVQKRLYQIKVHPATKDKYARCCEYVHTFYTQKQPDNMPWEEWNRVKLTERKVLTYLKRALSLQNKPPEEDKIRLVLQMADSYIRATVPRHGGRSRKQERPIHRSIRPFWITNRNPTRGMKNF